MSVVVLYFLPVRELLAVTLTPGSGMLPSLTVPWMVPPESGACPGAGVAWAGVGAAGGAGAAAGAVWAMAVALASMRETARARKLIGDIIGLILWVRRRLRIGGWS